ncbi:MAG: spondin domain-containing protein [Anaerolineae bacterium]|nr:spondin domain-containing protein [Anaerolineae bacterium]
MSPLSPQPTPVPVSPAQYRLTFEATWSAATHPTDFPPNPHFSGLIGAAHRPDVRLWQVGELASPGIKTMAETGVKNPLNGEIDALIAAGDACVKISGEGIHPSPGTVAVVFEVNGDCPAISVATMIAPSPDWFVGVSALSLLEDGVWVDEKVIDLFPYDAGTDSGVSYTSPDLPSPRLEGIFMIEGGPLLVGGSVPPLGTFTFTRLAG